MLFSCVLRRQANFLDTYLIGILESNKYVVCTAQEEIFFVVNLIQSLLTPPGIFIVLLLALSILALRRPAKKLMACALFFLAIVIYIFSLPIFAIFLSRSLDYRFTPQLPPKNEEAVLLVLGGGSTRDENGEPFQPSINTMERLYAAIKLAKEHRNYTTMILSGGDVYERSKISGADIMKRACDVMGCPAKIILEGKSRNTDENLKYSTEIIKQLGIKNVIIITQNFHMERSMDLAKKYIPEDIKTYAYPSSGSDKSRFLGFQPKMLIPNMRAFNFTCSRLRECVGIIVAKL